MKIRLYDKVIDTNKIKKLHKKKKRLYCDYGLDTIAHYCIEMIDDTYQVINKQEYKLLKKVMNNEK